MGSLVKRVSIFGLMVFAITGCNDVYIPPATLELVIEGAAGLLEGVQVCEGDTNNCVPSDADGKVTIELPFDRETFYTLAKEGYDSMLFADILTETPSSRVWYLQTDEEIAPLYEELMSPYPRRGTGQIQIITNPIAGATFDLVGATGTRYYEPYQDPWDPPPYTDPALEATSENGAGGFVDLTPGTVQIQFGGTATDCVPDTAWPDVDNRIRVPVLQDHNSIVFVVCPVPP